MVAVLSFFPEEERVKYSAMTGQSLYYLGETNLKHKILAVVEEAGAEKASYALKLLQSEGELTIASTGNLCSLGNDGEWQEICRKLTIHLLSPPTPTRCACKRSRTRRLKCSTT
jgi:hypothetical protein